LSVAAHYQARAPPRGRRLSRSGHELLQRLGTDASQLDLARGRRLDCLARALVALPNRVVHSEVDGELGEDGDAVDLVAPLQGHRVEVKASVLAHQAVKEPKLVLAVHGKQRRRRPHAAAQVLPT